MTTPFSRREFLLASGAGLAALSTNHLLAADKHSAGLPRRKLGKLGWETSLIGFGCGSRYMAQENEEVAARMFDRAIEAGVNYFDTAFSYTKAGARLSFKRVGAYLVPKYRQQIYLASKLGERDAESAKRNFEISLKELGTDRLDVLHFHSVAKKEDVDQIVAEDGALKFYRQLKDQGVIKAIGVTGHSSASVLIDAIDRIQPDVLMCPQNPAHSGELAGHDFARVIPHAAAKGVGMIAMKTTARNGLIGKNGVTAPELVRYALSLPVSCAVIGMPSVEVIESCAEIARTHQPLPAADRESLEKKLAAAHQNSWLPYLMADYRECGGSQFA